MEHCISCALFRPLYGNAMEFANAAVVAMSPPALEALKAFSGLWFMFVLYRAMFQGRFEGAKVLTVLSSNDADYLQLVRTAASRGDADASEKLKDRRRKRARSGK